MLFRGLFGSYFFSFSDSKHYLFKICEGFFIAVLLKKQTNQLLINGFISIFYMGFPIFLYNYMAFIQILSSCLKTKL